MVRYLRQPRVLALLAWLAAFATSVAVTGYPTRRTSVLFWIALAVLAAGADRPRTTLRSFATTWLPLFAALGTYDLLRGASDPSSQAAAHTWPHVDLDLWLGGGTTPSEHLQRWLWWPGDPAWWDIATWLVYQSHFVVPLLAAVAMWALRHRLARRYVVGLALLSWSALATYWLYPAQPPWMVARDGLIGDLDRIIPQMWRDVGVDRAARVFTTSGHNVNRYANPVAALPSLHAALPMLIATCCWGTRRWLDAVLATYVLAMAFTLVYTGEHFTFDIALGWTYALAIGLLVRQARWSRTGTSPIDGVDPQLVLAGAGGIADERPLATSRSSSTGVPHTDDTSS